MRDERGKPCAICIEQPAKYRTVRRCRSCHSAARRKPKVPLSATCCICDKQETATRGGRPKRLARDHSHTTGAHRGLLCQRCNVLLGMALDDPDVLDRAAAYLRAAVRAA